MRVTEMRMMAWSCHELIRKYLRKVSHMGCSSGGYDIRGIIFSNVYDCMN